MTVTHLARDLNARGRLHNAFGPTSDGDAMVAASARLSRLAWAAVELADYTDELVAILSDLGAMDPETAAVLAEVTAIVRQEES